MFEHQRADLPTLSRTVPFAVFMSFIALEEGYRFMVAHGLLSTPDHLVLYLYPLKAVTVAALLYRFFENYDEFSPADLLDLRTSALSGLVGVATFVVWITADWAFSVTGATRGFDPALLPQGWTAATMTAVRLGSAVLVVPLMEELFWRSFLLRYLVRHDFQRVPLGAFTWSSFLITTVLFGLEHHLIVAGMLAGAAYNALLYKTRSLAHCVLAHAVTNLFLGIYVLASGRWDLW